MSDAGPGVHPDPPEDFAQRAFPLVEVDGPLWRIYQNQYDNPLYFREQPKYRFDAPEGAFGVCYCA